MEILQNNIDNPVSDCVTGEKNGVDAKDGKRKSKRNISAETSDRNFLNILKRINPEQSHTLEFIKIYKKSFFPRPVINAA